MAADLDLSPEVVERFRSFVECAADPQGAAATICALSAELAAARGALKWRPIETAPETEEDKPILVWDGASPCIAWGYWGADGKRKWYGEELRVMATHWLPLPAPPSAQDTPTLDDLLSIATDDEADAIRACAARLAETEGGA